MTHALPLLMTHVVVGYPSLQESEELVLAMVRGGASLVELQIPFSDPIADGPTISQANQLALAQGVTPDSCMKLMKRLSKRVSVPLIFMSYLNPLLSYRGGIRGFLRDAADAGAYGVIVPDMPPDIAVAPGEFRLGELCTRVGLRNIPIVTPITDLSRLREIHKTVGDGFVYCVSTTGTTGARGKLPDGLSEYLERVRRVFNLPRAVGFGISKREHLVSLAGKCEIAVVGSRIIDVVRIAPVKGRVRAVERFVRDLVR